MKKPGKHAKAKSSAKGTKRKSKAPAKAVQTRTKIKSKAKSKPSTKRRTTSGERPAVQTKPHAAVTIPKTPAKFKDVAKKAVTAAIVAAGVAVVDTALGEMNAGEKPTADRGTKSEEAGHGGSDDPDTRR